jgi:hypothetical protein
LAKRGEKGGGGFFVEFEFSLKPVNGWTGSRKEDKVVPIMRLSFLKFIVFRHLTQNFASIIVFHKTFHERLSRCSDRKHFRKCIRRTSLKTSNELLKRHLE